MDLLSLLSGFHLIQPPPIFQNYICWVSYIMGGIPTDIIAIIQGNKFSTSSICLASALFYSFNLTPNHILPPPLIHDCCTASNLPHKVLYFLSIWVGGVVGTHIANLHHRYILEIYYPWPPITITPPPYNYFPHHWQKTLWLGAWINKEGAESLYELTTHTTWPPNQELPPLTPSYYGQEGFPIILTSLFKLIVVTFHTSPTRVWGRHTWCNFGVWLALNRHTPLKLVTKHL